MPTYPNIVAKQRPMPLRQITIEVFNSSNRLHEIFLDAPKWKDSKTVFLTESKKAISQKVLIAGCERYLNPAAGVFWLSNI